MRAYVITSQAGGKTRVIGLKSSKKLAITACEDEAETEAKSGHWEDQEKHNGRFVGDQISASYEMFYVNE